MDSRLETNLCKVADGVEAAFIALRMALHQGDVRQARHHSVSISGHLDSATWYLHHAGDDEIQEWFHTRFRNI